MSPEVEKLRRVILPRGEFVAKLKYAGMIVVAGGMESEPIGRDVKFLCSLSGSRVNDAAVAQAVNDGVAIGSVGLSVPVYDTAEIVF